MHWIFAHLIGDYLIQTDWMASKKKENSWVCLVHVLTYLVPFLLTPLNWWQLSLIGVQHFIQDRTTLVENFMIYTGKRQFTKAPNAPWSLILLDNILHILFIALVAAWL